MKRPWVKIALLIRTFKLRVTVAYKVLFARNSYKIIFVTQTDGKKVTLCDTFWNTDKLNLDEKLYFSQITDLVGKEPP